MKKPDGIEWGYYFDAVHIISVNYGRQEVRLFENAGSGEGKLLFKKDDSAAKVSLNDPFQLMNMAIHFVVSYDLLVQLADEELLQFFEQVGIKDFLERLVAATTEQDRRYRFSGFGPKFMPFTKETRTPGQTSPTNEVKPTPPPETPPTNESKAGEQSATTGEGASTNRRGRGQQPDKIVEVEHKAD